jgi:hypothetical protein
MSFICLHCLRRGVDKIGFAEVSSDPSALYPSLDRCRHEHTPVDVQVVYLIGLLSFNPSYRLLDDLSIFNRQGKQLHAVVKDADYRQLV